MRLKSEFSVVKIPGGWNLSVFTPEWVAKNIFFSEGKIMLEASLGAELTVNYIFGNVKLIVKNDMLSINILNGDLAVFEKIEEITTKLVEYFPHTPVSAIGTNIAFESNGDEDNISSIFNLGDSLKLQDVGLGEFEDISLKRSFSLDGQRTLNLVIEKDENNKASVVCNYHKQLNNIIEIKDQMRVGCLTESYVETKKLIESLYDVEID